MTQDVLTAPGFTQISERSVEEIAARRDEPSWLRERRAFQQTRVYGGTAGGESSDNIRHQTADIRGGESEEQTANTQDQRRLARREEFFAYRHLRGRCEQLARVDVQHAHLAGP